jgi:hypothetical protein
MNTSVVFMWSGARWCAALAGAAPAGLLYHRPFIASDIVLRIARFVSAVALDFFAPPLDCDSVRERFTSEFLRI